MSKPSSARPRWFEPISKIPLARNTRLRRDEIRDFPLALEQPQGNRWIRESLVHRPWRYATYDLLIAESTQEVAGRFRRVAVSWKIQGLCVPLTHQQAPAGIGMVTGWRLTDAQSTTVTY